MNVTYQTETINRANILAIRYKLAARNKKLMDKRKVVLFVCVGGGPYYLESNSFHEKIILTLWAH